MSSFPTRRKAVAVALGLGLTAGLSTWLKPKLKFDEKRRHLPLENLFPRSVGTWKTDRIGEAFVLSADQQGKLYQIYDQVLERTYVDGKGHRMMLSVAYGGEQSAGLQMHRPEICYVGSGYSVDGVRGGRIDLAGRRIPVTRLVARLGSRIEPITYWTVLGDEVVPDAREFHLRQVLFGLKGEILDGMLVRISSVDADVDGAWRVQAEFARELAQAMDERARMRVLGLQPPASINTAAG
jgi:EpsI family protein